MKVITGSDDSDGDDDGDDSDDDDDDSDGSDDNDDELLLALPTSQLTEYLFPTQQREHLCRKLDHLTERLKQAESKKVGIFECVVSVVETWF